MAQRVLGHVREEVADVQRRVAVAVEVEVQPGEVRARVRHEDLVGVAVAVDAAAGAVGECRAEGVQRGQECGDAFCQQGA